MAVSGSNLATASATSSTSISTASISPASNNLLLASVVQRTGTGTNPNQPTLSGNGLTWDLVATILYDTSPSSLKRLSVFRAMGASPSAGAVTADFGGQTNSDACISVDQFSGVDTSGTNGSGAIVQSASNKNEVAGGTATTLTVTLSAFGSVNNATFGAFGQTSTSTATPGSGFTELSDVNTGGLPLSTIWRVDNDTTVDITFSAAGNEIGGIACEIKASAAANVTVTPSTASLTTSTFAPVLKQIVTPTTKALTLTRFAPVLRNQVSPAPVSLLTSFFVPVLRQSVIPGTRSLSITTFAPQLRTHLTPATHTISLTAFAPALSMKVTPAVQSLNLATFAPVLAYQLIVPSTSLSLTRLAPQLRQRVNVPPRSLSIQTFAANLETAVVPPTLILSLTAFVPGLRTVVTPGARALSLTTFGPVLQLRVTPQTRALVLTTFSPTITGPFAFHGDLLAALVTNNLLESAIVNSNMNTVSVTSNLHQVEIVNG